MCREPETATRCRTVEHILAGLHVPWPFRQHGCAEMIPYASEQAHKASCAHVPRHCPISGCSGYAGKPLREHVRQDHPGVVHTVVPPRCLTPLRMRAHEQARMVRLGDGGAEFLIVVGQYKQQGRALSVVRLVGKSVDKQDFKHRIEVVGKAGVLSLSGETLDGERLVLPYEASPFLFVPNETWDSPENILVFIELK
jgi:E3 ubiquitin-protein ligase SIAH1